MKYLAIVLSLLALAISLVTIFRNAPIADAFEGLKITNALAGIVGSCPQESPRIVSSFNNKNQKPIKIALDSNSGVENHHPCVLTFPFKVTGHVVIATPKGTTSSVLQITDSQLDSTLSDRELRFHVESSTDPNSFFYLVVY